MKVQKNESDERINILKNLKVNICSSFVLKSIF